MILRILRILMILKSKVICWFGTKVCAINSCVEIRVGGSQRRIVQHRLPISINISPENSVAIIRKLGRILLGLSRIRSGGLAIVSFMSLTIKVTKCNLLSWGIKYILLQLIKTSISSQSNLIYYRESTDIPLYRGITGEFNFTFLGSRSKQVSTI